MTEIPVVAAYVTDPQMKIIAIAGKPILIEWVDGHDRGKILRTDTLTYEGLAASKPDPQK